MRLLNDKMVKVIVTGLGTGYCPVAPGTAGTIVAVPLYFILSPFSWPLYLITLLAATVLSCRLCDTGERLFGVKDPPQIVIDEIIGFLWAMFAVPPTTFSILGVFLIFRLFDVVKPHPVRLLENRLPGGWGVVMDDVAAGIYANICIHILTTLWEIR